jgi:hypothetical protein
MFVRRINLVVIMVCRAHNWMTTTPGVASIGVYGKAFRTDAMNVKRPPAGSRLNTICKTR